MIIDNTCFSRCRHFFCSSNSRIRIAAFQVSSSQISEKTQTKQTQLTLEKEYFMSIYSNQV
jgi:hypothetical protein